MVISPLSTIYVPATALRSVDLPAPLPPITVTKSPSFKVRDTPFKATFSLTVPSLKTLVIFLISTIILPPYYSLTF